MRMTRLVNGRQRDALGRTQHETPERILMHIIEDVLEDAQRKIEYNVNVPKDNMEGNLAESTRSPRRSWIAGCC
jgi:3-dehydroquinate dehydratase